MILFMYCYSRLFYIFTVYVVFLEICSDFIKRQIKIVPIYIGLRSKQILCVVRKDKTVYIDEDRYICVSITLSV